eukprot:scaffold1362_cov163-Amphora_coffeaeformis.AAC.21
MKKRSLRSLFSGRGLHKAKQSPEEIATVRGIEKLQSALPPEVLVGKEEEQEKQKDHEEEEWGEDVLPEETEEVVHHKTGATRDKAPSCTWDTYSWAPSLAPTSASSTALRYGKTFDQSEASSFSLASRGNQDLFDPKDAESILASVIPPSLLNRRRKHKHDDNSSVANSSVSTRTSAAQLFKAHTFDLTGANIFGTPTVNDSGAESSKDTSEESSGSILNMHPQGSLDFSYGQVFQYDMHSFLNRVFNPQLGDGDD